MNKLIILFLLIIGFASCQPELTKDFSFLEGSWKMVVDDSTYILETWEKIDEQHYSALNYEVSDAGMKLSQENEIEITDSGTFFRPTIQVVDGGRQFEYKFISQDNNKYIFTNDVLEVSAIWYRPIDDNHLELGIQNIKGEDQFTLSFEKVSEPNL